ncbi:MULTISPECIES: SdpI family protein [Rhodococcus]|uniref:SdpI family protein n=1 Tax=Rhodococcus oxybenzonivorans TaxID=1990687 RepID=A0AAE4V354_9NOCA|nr:MULTISPECIES: SdpI family protein [Rhodococcus]MDV7246014.1 SdpI family protein [Rhodococcus oxybenzonivorans]MDV7267748.1 SdpI family protein [Rhodococcus oxybenzonivorans]MDV7277609.1 SdpI family protein [Rhodococcus oxybenzonivorans]MDV7337027.1 SdpI family protein [Rhodococcus oxybenzonivorans]MDV7347379.1 SdpI family protein [Rhodococcus oxybenzonivorans]
MLIASVVLFVLAVAVAGVALAGLTERLPRNRWAGVRTAETLRDDDAFALANKVAGPTLLAAAGLLIIGGVAGILVGGVIGIGALLVSVVAAALTAGTGGSLGARAAAAVPAADTGACGNSCGACSLKDACQPS